MTAPLPRGATGTVAAVCVVAALHGDSGSVGTTAIDKRPVSGPVSVGPLGLYADVQADRAHHGGPDQAVYLIDETEREHWAGELGRELPAGTLGENLSVRGLAIDDLEIGAVLEVGTAVLEVTAPRTPCMTFQRWMGTEDFRARYHQRGRTGVYVRVTTPGNVEAGDALRVVSTPGHGVTVAACYAGTRDRELAERLAAWSEESGAGLHREITARIERLTGSRG